MQQRPVYLNIFTFAFPITAIISILHRLSGVFLLILIPTFLGLLQDILYYPWSQVILSSFWVWLALSAFGYHFFAGIRHLCMDIGFAESKHAARISSYVVLALSILFSIIVGLSLC